jgi:hypothetical protein
MFEEIAYHLDPFLTFESEAGLETQRGNLPVASPLVHVDCSQDHLSTSRSDQNDILDGRTGPSNDVAVIYRRQCRSKFRATGLSQTVSQPALYFSIIYFLLNNQDQLESVSCRVSCFDVRH